MLKEAVAADLARQALRRIAELRLPPTPENFSRYYYEAAGGTVPAPPAAQPAAKLDAQLVQRVDDLVRDASVTTGQLVAGLGLRSDDLASSLDGLVAQDHADSAVVLRGVVATAKEIQLSVTASHAELLATRRNLDEIQAELAENRKLLGQDPLTGTENRRAMSLILDREMTRARLDNEPLAVAMIDVDHFKQVNDRHGHAAGDAALVHLTRIAKAMLRGNDAFIRYGGEEFVLVLPETALQGGVFAAERLRLMLERKPLQFDGNDISMTFSAGVTVLQDDDTEVSLLARADAGLYRAKHSGRNQVCAV